MIKKILFFIPLAMALILLSCSPEEEAVNGRTETRVGIVVDSAGINDGSFNQSAWEGLKRAEENLNVATSYADSLKSNEYMVSLESLTESGNELVIGNGFKLADDILEASRRYPEQSYAILDYSYGDNTPDNVVGVVFKSEQSAFLVGYIAGLMTDSNQVGFVGGIEDHVIHQFEYGYRAGVDQANKESGKSVEVKSEYVGSFHNTARGKAIAQDMYKSGVDIVFHAAGGAGHGVIEAGVETDNYVIGVDRDQNHIAPNHVITSAIKRVDMAAYNLVEDLSKGRFEGGTTKVYGIADGAVDIADSTEKHVPSYILNRVGYLKDKMRSGELEVPYDSESYGEYRKEVYQ